MHRGLLHVPQLVLFEFVILDDVTMSYMFLALSYIVRGRSGKTRFVLAVEEDAIMLFRYAIHIRSTCSISEIEGRLAF